MQVILFVAIVALFIFTVACAIEENYKLSLALFFLLLGNITWLVIASNQPFKIDYVQEFPLETIHQKDGTMQIISFSPVSKMDVTARFGKVFPENFIVRKTAYNAWNCGIYFAGIGVNWEIIDPDK